MTAVSLLVRRTTGNMHIEKHWEGNIQLINQQFSSSGFEHTSFPIGDSGHTQWRGERRHISSSPSGMKDTTSILMTRSFVLIM